MSGQSSQSMHRSMSDLFTSLSITLEKASVAAQDLTCEYFSSPAPEAWALQAGYQRNATRADIMLDYLMAALREVQNASEKLRKEASA